MAQPPPEPIPLPSPPNDGITSLAYLPPTAAGNLLASTSWDGALRIHDAGKKTHLVTRLMECGPILSMAVAGAPGSGGNGVSGGSGGNTNTVGGSTDEIGSIYTGGIDGTLKKFDIANNTVTLIGMHSPKSTNEKKVACSCLNLLNHGPLLASAGWDSFFHVWDGRISAKSGKGAAVTLELPGKAFSMDAAGDGSKVVVGTSGRKMCFFDIRMPIIRDVTEDKENDESEINSTIAKLLMERESSLKYQTRCVRFFSDGVGIAVGSIEGRVGIEYLDDVGISSGGKKKYAFKCHRQNDTIYPVNAIAFHPTQSSCIFATGGADGTVTTWDGNHKKKLSSIAKLPTSIACLAWNHDGTQLAMGSSYTFEEGERDHYLREEIYVRDVLEGEVRPKKGGK